MRKLWFLLISLPISAQVYNPTVLPWNSSTLPTVCPVIPLYVIGSGFTGQGNVYGNSGTGTTCALIATPASSPGGPYLPLAGGAITGAVTTSGAGTIAATTVGNTLTSSSSALYPCLMMASATGNQGCNTPATIVFYPASGVISVGSGYWGTYYQDPTGNLNYLLMTGTANVTSQFICRGMTTAACFSISNTSGSTGDDFDLFNPSGSTGFKVDYQGNATALGTISSGGNLVLTASQGTISTGPAIFGSSAVNTVVATTIASQAGHFTNLAITSALGGTCTTAPTFNVFDGTTNVGTAKLATSTTQTKGTTTNQTQTLTFAAGDVIGIYISVAGSVCTTDTWVVSAQYSTP